MEETVELLQHSEIDFLIAPTLKNWLSIINRLFQEF